MRTISLLEFRKNARKVIHGAQRGQSMIITYRGKPVCRLEPIRDAQPSEDDRLYSLSNLADETSENLTNSEMDRIVYEE
ncbi:MAG: type II toxin-antitoxin system Phd/YefM family antitoxin [Chitinivibrionales bacterium]|nr:type II toxin-antitoxin system Phd/YefM family antitoxin [Chitinivibrionales bacterium]